jgi:hypothetical protein|nr:MAG TPA: Protein DA1 [Caudoviricetes sp.]
MLMEFEINNTTWTIEKVDEATINNEMKSDGTLGVTIYKNQKIMLLKDQANIIKTLKHELTHVWLYEYGHNQNDNKTFTYEDVCEIVASLHDFISEVVEQYKEQNQSYIERLKKNYKDDYIDAIRYAVQSQKENENVFKSKSKENKKFECKNSSNQK